VEKVNTPLESAEKEAEFYMIYKIEQDLHDFEMADDGSLCLLRLCEKDQNVGLLR
jgi:hypothetical protein